MGEAQYKRQDLTSVLYASGRSHLFSNVGLRTVHARLRCILWSTLARMSEPLYTANNITARRKECLGYELYMIHRKKRQDVANEFST